MAVLENKRTNHISGWTPQTFVSSRSDRTKKKVARPEDYMDEEDLAELRENQVKSGIQEKMDLLGGTQAELGRLGGTGDEEEECAIIPHLSRVTY